jgi:molybdopterin-guanine dinucleotide biosynthesis protein A
MRTIAIQAGGQSQRMGTNKALVNFLGQKLIERVLARVISAADEVIVTTNHPEFFDLPNIRLVPDTIPGKGALGGIYSALLNARGDRVGVVACDMPFVNPNLLVQQFQWLEETQSDVVIPKFSKGYEPLHAVYNKNRCLEAILAAINSGETRLISWLKQVRVMEIYEEDLQKVDPGLYSFINVNTPEELYQAEQLAKNSPDVQDTYKL